MVVVHDGCPRTTTFQLSSRSFKGHVFQINLFPVERLSLKAMCSRSTSSRLSGCCWKPCGPLTCASMDMCPKERMSHSYHQGGLLHMFQWTCVPKSSDALHMPHFTCVSIFRFRTVPPLVVLDECPTYICPRYSCKGYGSYTLRHVPQWTCVSLHMFQFLDRSTQRQDVILFTTYVVITCAPKVGWYTLYPHCGY